LDIEEGAGFDLIDPERISSTILAVVP
jgi:hypothetical protein